MFSLKEWNFEEYKAAVKEIEDPVDRLDELNAKLNYAYVDCMYSHNWVDKERSSLIAKRMDIFSAWVDQEIKSLKSEFNDLTRIIHKNG